VAAGLQIDDATFASGHVRGGSFDLVRDLPDAEDETEAEAGEEFIAPAEVEADEL
jgi:hypothetical protein